MFCLNRHNVFVVSGKYYKVPTSNLKKKVHTNKIIENVGSEDFLTRFLRNLVGGEDGDLSQYKDSLRGSR